MVLHGPRARVVVDIGGMIEGTPITMQVVRSVSCNECKPYGPASLLASADYRLGGGRMRGPQARRCNIAITLEGALN